MMTALRLSRILSVCGALALLLLLAPGVSAQPVYSGTTHTVTTLADEDDGTLSSGSGAGTSLREAVLYSAAGDAIDFDVSLSGTILLTLGEITIDHDLIIEGPGRSVIDVSGLGESRVFSVDSAVALALSGVTLSSGRALDGGAIISEGWLQVQDCALRTSTAVQHGGAIYHFGSTLRIENCSIEFSTAYLNGGAVAAMGDSLIIDDSELSYNRANNEGGALFVAAGVSAVLMQSTLADNEARSGAGLANEGSIALTLSTISSNSASSLGGGILNSGTIAADFCTIAMNSASAGGGVHTSGTFSTMRSLYAENSAGANEDVAGSFTSWGSNLVGIAGSSSGWSGADLTGTDDEPKIASLDGLYLNGGNTRTHALMICSEAIDAADTTGTFGTYDQRGLMRNVNGDNAPGARPDIGAFEAQSILDNTPPFVMVNTDYIAFLDSLTGEATLKPEQLMVYVTDECKIISKTISKTLLTCADLGGTSVYLRVEDQSHNVWDTTMTVNVGDVTAPKLTVPPPAIVNAPAGACIVDLTTALIGNATATDNCSVASITFSPSSGIPVGVSSVLWTAEDSEGNIVVARQTVTVVDVTAPVASAPADMTLNTSTSGCNVLLSDIDLGSPTVTEACGFDIINDAPVSFPLGTTVVTWTITDESGNFVDVTQNVTVQDLVPPTITAPPDLILSADASSCSRLVSNVTLGTPNVGDNCSIASYSAAQPPLEYPIGVTNVLWTITDGSGNTAQATQKVTIVDVNPPSITAPADIEVFADAGQCYWTVNSATLGTPTNVGDNCGVPTATNNAGSTLAVGLHRILWTATDVNGNFTTDVQLVTVKSQMPTISCPSNISVFTDAGKPGAVVSYTVPVGGSTCPGIETIRTKGLGSGAFFPVGTTTEEYTVIDASNQAVSCSFTITVTDNEAPQISVSMAPENLWPANNQLVTVYATVELDDNSEGVTAKLTSVSSDQPPDAPDIVGASTGTFDDLFQLRAKKQNNADRTYTVTYTATDAYGNTASASATVTVPSVKPKDYVAPELPVPDGMTLAQNYPNPFNPSTTISFGIPDAQRVRLFIYDAMGRLVRTLVDLDLDAGVYNLSWDARTDDGVSLPSGMYIYRLLAGEQRLERKMLLTR